MAIKELPRPKPASPPEVIEFLRELLLTAYAENIECVIYGFVSKSGLEANGMIMPGISARQVDRVLDLTEAWVSDLEYIEVGTEDETGE